MWNLFLFAAGLVGLVVGADLLVRGAGKLALSFGISPLVVGLTIVAFGTSAPEMAVSVSAVLNDNADMAVGNVVGSNIFNVLFILGVSALIVPLVVNRQLIRQEVPIMFGVSLLMWLFVRDGAVQAWEGGVLLAIMVVYTAFLVIQSRRETQGAGSASADSDSAELQALDGDLTPPAPTDWDGRLPAQLALIAVGLVLLVLGSDWLVTASVAFAKALGVSDVVIALTIVAAGTSMPEVATSVTAAIKGQRDMAVGNVVGSNTFNILGCLGLSGLVAGGAGLPVAQSVLAFDMWVMLAVALACLPVFLTGREIARWEGAVFVGYYVAYVGYLILSAQAHDALPLYSNAMLGFVVPLTVVTLVVSLIRADKPGAEAGSA